MPFKYNALLGLGLDNTIPLDGAGKIPSTFLPSYVDDVEEYNNLAAFPATGETGKIYVAIDTGFVYRWSGSVYVQIGITAAAGSTTQVQFNDAGAFGGDSGLTFDKTTDALSAGGFIPTSSTVPANGIYLPAANSVAVSTGGTGRLFVDASGLVGVGAAPATILDSTQSAAAAYSSWTLRNTAADGYVQQQFLVGASGANGQATVSYAPGIFFAVGPTANDTSTPIVFRNNNGSERLRITSAGLVGIGTSAPSVRLQVQNSIAGGSDGTIATLHNVSDTGGDTRYSGLNFVIGSDNGTSAIRAARTLSAVDYRTELSFWTNPTGATQTPVRAMTIDYLQRVGIGVTAPQTQLHLSSSVLNSSSIRIDRGTGAQNYLLLGLDGGESAITANGTTGINAALIFKRDSNTGTPTESARIDSSGRLLVGTSSASGTNTLFESSSTTADAANVALVKRNSGSADQAGQQLHFYNFGPAGTGRAADTEVGSMRFYGSQPTSGGAQEMARITCAADLIQTGTNTSGRLVFSTTADGAASPTERLRITSTGQVRLAGAGITFNGDTAAANELDDYEEGTWTPTITRGGGAVNPTYTDQTGYYVKIGRCVYVWGNVTWSAIGATSSIDNIIQGLPFSAGTSQKNGWVNFGSSSGVATNPVLAAIVFNTELYLRKSANILASTNIAEDYSASGNFGFNGMYNIL